MPYDDDYLNRSRGALDTLRRLSIIQGGLSGSVQVQGESNSEDIGEASCNDELEDDRIPERFKTIPFGIGTELVEWILSQSPHPNPLFAVQAALSFGGLVLSRWHRTEYDNHPVLYALILGKTAIGKESVKSAIEQMLYESECESWIGSRSFSHSSAIYSALRKNPKQIAILDEFGKMLYEQKNRNSPMNQVLAYFMELFSKANGRQLPPGMSSLGLDDQQEKELDARRRPIVNPAFHIVGLSTPETFFESLEHSNLSSGLVNRFIVVYSSRKRGKMQRFKKLPVPDGVKEWVSRMRENDNLMQAQCTCPYDVQPDGQEWQFTPEAMQVFDAYEDQCIQYAEELDKDGDGAGNQVSRTLEIAMRLSLIVASFDGRSEVDSEHAQWSIDYVMLHLKRLVRIIEEHMHGSAFEAHRKGIAKQIRAAGKEGISRRNLLRLAPAKHLKPSEFVEIIDSLEISELIRTEKIKPGENGGRPSIKYFNMR